MSRNNRLTKDSCNALRTGRNTTKNSSFNEAYKHVVISYNFEKRERMIPPSLKSRIYPSVRQT